MGVGQGGESGVERLHPHHHPRTTPVRGVVDLAMPAEAMAAEIDQVHRRHPVLPGATHQPHLQGAGEEPGKERDDRYAHPPPAYGRRRRRRP